MAEFLSLEEVKRAFELGESTYRPSEIVELKKQIEGETRAAELNYSVTGVIDHDRIHRIVAMKRRLDDLYGAWVQGKIS